MKRFVPLLIASMCGLVMVVSYFIPWAQPWGEAVGIWFNILAAIAFVLGGGSLIKMQLKKMSNREAGWGYAAVVLATFFLMLFAGLFKRIWSNPSEQYPDKPWSGNHLEVGSLFEFLYQYGFKPLTATMFAMLAFYVASAAFRAFRAKNIEAILLLGTAFVILLGRTFAGPYLTGWIPEDSFFVGLKMENLTNTIMNVFATAGNRAIMIGIALGTASVSLKIILGVDRSYLGSAD